MITPSEKLKCAERELHYRKRVYGRMVSKGSMSEADRDHEIAVMEAIRDDYCRQVEAWHYNWNCWDDEMWLLCNRQN